jgi:Tol biopolymer transport system component
LSPATRLDPPRQITHWFPEFLPDGRHFLFLSKGQLEHRGVYVGSLDSLETHRLLDSESPARFLPPDRLLFWRDGALLAQRLDSKDFRLVGEPSVVAPNVALVPADGNTITVSTSASGGIAYRTHLGEQQLQWMDRAGQLIGTIGTPDSAMPALHRLSRDGRTIALVRTVDGNQDIWLIDVQSGGMRRLTTEPVRERFPAWSPDGRRVAFASERDGGYDLFESPVDGSGPETTLLVSPGTQWPEDWTPGFLLYRVSNETTDDDLWVLPLTGNRKPMPVVEGPMADRGGRFSPDGRWLVYTSAESGRGEVYVQPFPGSGGRIQISKDGGRVPEWRRDGRELFYRGVGDTLMMVTINVKGGVLEPGVPAPLLTLPRNSTFLEALDGQRFLVLTMTKEPAPITVVNWSRKTQ